MSKKATSAAALNKTPGVLSFQRGIIISDGPFENIFEDKSRPPTPVQVIRHGIRGTQSQNTDKENNPNNIQITESAKTDPEANGVRVGFELRMLPIDSLLFSCSGKGQKEFRDNYQAFCDTAKKGDGLKEVCRRYARNILNGRWLWRNLALGQNIEVTVTADGKEIAKVNALTVSKSHFNDFSKEELAVAEALHQGLLGEHSQIRVSADINFGIKGSIEVFPSQNYLGGEKPSGFARSLFKVNVQNLQKHQTDVLRFDDFQIRGQAALRDQKISNALRTIDTWYNEKTELEHIGPISVEPTGANLAYNHFFRKDPKFNGFELLKGMGSEVMPDTDQGMFLLACIIRGGVFSSSEKPEKTKKGEAAESESSED